MPSLAKFAVTALVLAIPVVHAKPKAPECDGKNLPEMRYSSSTKRLYLENGEGKCATLTDIYRAGQDKKTEWPLYVLDSKGKIKEKGSKPTGKWLLVEELYVEDGATLALDGDEDCNELRILSDKGTDAINLRAHGGNLWIHKTKIVGWDYKGNKPDDDGWRGAEKDENGDSIKPKGTGRAFITCISEVKDNESCDGKAKNDMGECRMDIIGSEISHLGTQSSEAYGLTWKVRGFCKDKSNLEVFDKVNVYGDIIDSDIHDNWFGMYSYGHEAGEWKNNKMHNNFQYGFDPHDDSDNLKIVGNKVWENGNHGIIASKRCNNVRIKKNKVWDNGQAGIMLHRSSDKAKVVNNEVWGNYDAGLAIMESFKLVVKGNQFTGCEDKAREKCKYGVRLSVGSGKNDIHDNVLDTFSRYAFYTYMGSDKPDVKGTTGRLIDNSFYDNEVKGSMASLIYLKQADGTEIFGNDFSGTKSSGKSDIAFMHFYDSLDTVYKDNSDGHLDDDDLWGIVSGSCFKEFSTSSNYELSKKSKC
ncbi:unnamed protein product [Discosporangium mesarthrocarpum]